MCIMAWGPQARRTLWTRGPLSHKGEQQPSINVFNTKNIRKCCFIDVFIDKYRFPLFTFFVRITFRSSASFLWSCVHPRTLSETVYVSMGSHKNWNIHGINVKYILCTQDLPWSSVNNFHLSYMSSILT
jgi:hypothetical protein